MKDLTREHELKTIFLFSLPILVGNLFQQLYNLADTVIVGNFLGKECLAAVGFSFQIHYLLIALSMGISMGQAYWFHVILAVRTWNLRKKLWIRDLLSAFASV